MHFELLDGLAIIAQAGIAHRVKSITGRTYNMAIPRHSKPLRNNLTISPVDIDEVMSLSEATTSEQSDYQDSLCESKGAANVSKAVPPFFMRRSVVIRG